MRTRFKSIVLLLASQLGGCAGVESSKALVNVPDKLNPGAAAALRLIVPASGVQIYACRASKDRPGSYEWVFVAPEADLYDVRGRRIGRHYGGPHWEADDGSKIVAAVKASADAPAAGAIAWLLLAAKSVGAQGVFDEVSSIQRVNTAGGMAPQSACTAAALGTTARILYTADYYFFSNRPSLQRTNGQASRTTDQFLGQSRTNEQFLLTPGKARVER